jgi:hypothetical protein
VYPAPASHNTGAFDASALLSALYRYTVPLRPVDNFHDNPWAAG